MLGVITKEGAKGSALLYAFGKLIGNTDMHNGNISYISDHGRPYDLAPAYDMLPMAFSPKVSGSISNVVATIAIDASIDNEIWHGALTLAHNYLVRLQAEQRFSDAFMECIVALRANIEAAAVQIGRLA